MNKTKWDDFVSASPQANIFCYTAFLDSMLTEYELITLEANEKIQLGAIVLKNADQIIKAPYPFTIYQGVLCCNEFFEMPFHKRSSWLISNLTFLLDAMKEELTRISFCLSHTFEDVRTFQWFHYHEPEKGMFNIDLRYTGILNLEHVTDFDTYLTMTRSVRRQEYRKALKEGFYAEKTNDIEILNRLHAMTFDRQNMVRSAKDEELLLSISKNALEKEFGEILVCYDKNGTAASASLFVYDKLYGYYLFGANDPEYRKSGAGTFLIFENIKRCMERKCLGVDFVGINSPNRGDFKTSFNAKPVNYYLVNWDKP
ncbi:MAG: GNAT family N-acetyltransferase [Bacteroidota bacterium]